MSGNTATVAIRRTISFLDDNSLTVVLEPGDLLQATSEPDAEGFQYFTHLRSGLTDLRLSPLEFTYIAVT